MLGVLYGCYLARALVSLDMRAEPCRLRCGAASELHAYNGRDSRGAVPIAPRLARMRRDFPGVRRFFEFPTVFWLNASDGMIRAVPLIGIVASLLAVYGGPPGYVGLVVCWLLWISVEPAGLMTRS